MNVFEKILERFKKLKGSDSLANMFISDVIKVIEEVKKEYNNGWVPCSERLPERNKDVLCWVKSKTISGTETYILGSCDNGFWFLKTYEIDRESFPVKDYEVIAWRPLPEPYKESEKE